MISTVLPILIPKVNTQARLSTNRGEQTSLRLELRRAARAESSAMMHLSINTSFLQLALLFIQTLYLNAEGFALVPTELAPIPCNDKAVEKLSRLAVTYINEDRADGYKFALNRVANVHLHAQVSGDKCLKRKLAHLKVVSVCVFLNYFF